MNENIPAADRERQQKSFIIRFCYWAIIALIIYLLVKYCLPVWVPFVIGAVIAAVLNRPVNFISRKTKIKRPYVCVVVILLFFAALAMLFALLGAQVVQAVSSFAASLPSLLTDTVQPMLNAAINAVQSIAEEHSVTLNDLSFLSQALSKGVSAASSALLNAVTSIATTVPDLLVKTIITIIATVFIALDYEKIHVFLARQIPESKLEIWHELRAFFGGTLPKCIGAYILIMSLTFTELTVGFLLFRIPHAVLLGVIIAIVDILPVLGTGTVLIPWSIIELVIGNFTRGIELIVLYLVITFVRNAVEPKLVGSQIGLHPVITFAGMLLGLKYAGLIGMFGVPLLTAFVLDLNRKGIISIFK